MSEIMVKNPRLIEHDRTNNDTKANKDSFIIIGDSMIKHVNGRNPGASIHDLMDYVKPATQKNRKALVIHTGTNGIQQEINARKMVKKLVKVIKEIDSEKKLKFYFLV